ncbi:MAG: hypothetical protein Q7J35_05650 [Candidatus Methanoperedens sp.]|nr:hypothetical protein [Candidatus Methanoperedens sp.]
MSPQMPLSHVRFEAPGIQPGEARRGASKVIRAGIHTNHNCPNKK